MATATNRFLDWYPGVDRTQSYTQYLRSAQYEHLLQESVRPGSLGAIGTRDQLLARGISMVDQTTQEGNLLLQFAIRDEGERMTAQLEAVGEEIRTVGAGIEARSNEVVSTLYWGFGFIADELRAVQDGVAELIYLERNPTRTAAEELYRVALRQSRQGHFPEALRSITRAIGGYETDYRYHALLGALRLGSSVNNSDDVVSPVLAEKAFLATARYAKGEGATGAAGRALVGAGRAAFVLGNFADAQKHLEDALKAVPAHSQGNYLLARTLIRIGDARGAAYRLEQAFYLNPSLAAFSRAEYEFSRATDMIDAAVAAASARLGRECLSMQEQCLIAVEKLRTFQVDRHYGRTLIPDRIERAGRTLPAAKRSADTGTLFGRFDAKLQLRSLAGQMPSIFEELLAAAKNALSEDASHAHADVRSGEDSVTSTREAHVEADSWTTSWPTIALSMLGWTPLVLILLGLTKCTLGLQSPVFGSFGGDIGGSVVIAILLAVLAARLMIGHGSSLRGRAVVTSESAKGALERAQDRITALNAEYARISSMATPSWVTIAT